MIETASVGLIAIEQVDGRESFSELVRAQKHSLVNYLSRMTGSRERAEELAQEAFVRLYQHRKRYADREDLVPLLFRVATNLLRGEHRKSARREVLRRIFGGGLGHGVPPTPDQALLQNEVQRVVASAIEKIPIRYRAPLVLREIEGWSYEQISGALQCPPGTVKSRIKRARDFLRAELGAYWNGEPHDE